MAIIPAYYKLNLHFMMLHKLHLVCSAGENELQTKTSSFNDWCDHNTNRSMFESKLHHLLCEVGQVT